jgi:hypothetical protein
VIVVVLYRAIIFVSLNSHFTAVLGKKVTLIVKLLLACKNFSADRHLRSAGLEERK